MSKPKVLVQLDSDEQPSVFDGVVAVDSQVDQLFRHGGIVPDAVRDLVYGAMFTRGPEDLHNTAIFVGGSDVSASEGLLKKVTECFFGPMRVSVMLDPNGANTTAAAAVLAAASHIDLQGAKATVLASTGPVGRRVVRLLTRAGATVGAASRSLERAQEVDADISSLVEGAEIRPHETMTPEGLAEALDGTEVLIAAGKPGIELLSEQQLQSCAALKVAIDLSAVPPVGLAGIDLQDKGTERNGVICYGALGVGGMKMKIHKGAIKKLFTANDLVLDAEEIFALGQELA